MRSGEGDSLDIEMCYAEQNRQMKELSQSGRNQRKATMYRESTAGDFEAAASTGCVKQKKCWCWVFRGNGALTIQIKSIVPNHSFHSSKCLLESAPPLVGNAFVLQVFRPRISNNNSERVNRLENKIFAE